MPFEYLRNEPIKCTECEEDMKLEVLQSNAGYYYGRQCKCGPYNRESIYYATMTGAALGLVTYLEE